MLYAYIYIYTHTHTHTSICIHIHTQLYVISAVSNLFGTRDQSPGRQFFHRVVDHFGVKLSDLRLSGIRFSQGPQNLDPSHAQLTIGFSLL